MRRSLRSAVLASLLASLAAPWPAAAHEGHEHAVELDRYSAGETAMDDFALSRPLDLGHLEWDGQIQADYALNPLVYETTLGDSDTEIASIVEHHLVVHLGLALGLVDRLVLFAGIPLTGMMQGDDQVAIAWFLERNADFSASVF